MYVPDDEWVAEERRHGRAENYWRGCRCDACTAANSSYAAGLDPTPRRRHGRTPPPERPLSATERDIIELHRRATSR